MDQAIAIKNIDSAIEALKGMREYMIKNNSSGIIECEINNTGLAQYCLDGYIVKYCDLGGRSMSIDLNIPNFVMFHDAVATAESSIDQSS